MIFRRDGNLRRARVCAALGLTLSIPATGELCAQATAASSARAEVPQVTLSGLVVDAVTLAPLSGASVQVEGMQSTGRVDNGGRYALSVPAGIRTVEVRLSGYGAASRRVRLLPGRSTRADFRLLAEAPLALEGMVVTGTAGSAMRREIGNQVTELSSADVVMTAATDFGDLLQGRASGVQVSDVAGQVGGASQIRLRGNNSIQPGANAPLVYVDGIRMESGALPVDVAVGAAPSALDLINPDDIDRIEIVKGPAATTLYGTEASSGVIQVFTKRGASGPPAWTLSVDQGVRHMGRRAGSLNGPDINPTGFYVNDCTVAVAYDTTGVGAGEAGRFVTSPDRQPGCPEGGSWLRSGYLQRYNLSVLGGGGRTTYFLSGRWTGEQGVVAPQGSYGYGGRANLTFRLAEGLDVGLSNNVQRRTITWIPDGDTPSGLPRNVMLGSAGDTPGNDDALALDNQLVSTIAQLQTSATIAWTPGSRWAHHLNLGVDHTTHDFTDRKPEGFYAEPAGALESDSDRTRTTTLDYAGSFSHQPGRDVASRLSFGGQLYEWSSHDRLGDDLAVDGQAAPDGEEVRRRVRSGGFFLQETLGWKNKVYLTGGMRWDGFSTFGDAYGLAAYPKLSAAYVISDEAFWPSDVVESFKLRAAWGQSGKAPSVFARETLWKTASANELEPAVVLSRFGDPDLGPERTSELELGFDASAFGGRLTLELTRYAQRTTDAIMLAPFAPSAGTGLRTLRNVGRVDNWGTEAALRLVPLRLAAVDWSVSLLYGTNDSEVVDVGAATTLPEGVREGLPLWSAYGDALMNPGEKEVAPILAKTMIGRLYPTRMLSVGTRMTLWQSLTLDVVGEGQYGHVRPAALAYEGMRQTSPSNPVWPYCAPVQARWDATRGPGTYADRITRSGLTTDQIAECIPQYSGEGVWTRPADFFRLRSATLAWRLPRSWVPGARTAQVSLQGKNLFTSTDYVGLDPEAGSGGPDDDTPRGYYTLGSPRALMLGVTVNF